jgi:hypothetical protein
VLFVAILLMGAGFTFAVAGVKGNNYTVKGVPVWSAPWLPWVEFFTPSKGKTAQDVSATATGNTLQGSAQASLASALSTGTTV